MLKFLPVVNTQATDVEEIRFKKTLEYFFNLAVEQGLIWLCRKQLSALNALDFTALLVILNTY